jgi:uncharacterized membrane protein
VFRNTGPRWAAAIQENTVCHAGVAIAYRRPMRHPLVLISSCAALAACAALPEGTDTESVEQAAGTGAEYVVKQRSRFEILGTIDAASSVKVSGDGRTTVTRTVIWRDLEDPNSGMTPRQKVAFTRAQTAAVAYAPSWNGVRVASTDISAPRMTYLTWTGTRYAPTLPSAFALGGAADVSADGNVFVLNHPYQRVATRFEFPARDTSLSPIIEVHGISHDGAWIAGVASGTVPHPALRSGTTTTDLSTAGGVAAAVADGGRVAVGWVDDAAFRWTPSSGLVKLGLALGGHPGSMARDTSRDGSVIVGTMRNTQRQYVDAWRWSGGSAKTVKQILLDNAAEQRDPLATASLDEATSVSGDGNVIVGRGRNASGALVAWHAILGGASFRALAGQADTANAISPDGLYVAGAAGGRPYVRKLDQASPTLIPNLPGATDGAAMAVSANGAVVVGWSGANAFRWTAATGTVLLKPLAGTSRCTPYGVSGDGSVVVGSCIGSTEIAFRWSAATGMTAINGAQRAWAVSADGRWVTGVMDDAGKTIAFRWSKEIITPLPSLSTTRTEATAISADGSVIYGAYDTAQGTAMFRWTAAGMESIPTISPTGRITVTGTSADGRVAVGEILDPMTWTQQVVRWSRYDGMVTMQEMLARKKIAPAAGWSVVSLRGVSGDGNVIAGWGLDPSGNQRALVMTVP